MPKQWNGSIWQNYDTVQPNMSMHESEPGAADFNAALDKARQDKAERQKDIADQISKLQVQGAALNNQELSDIVDPTATLPNGATTNFKKIKKGA